MDQLRAEDERFAKPPSSPRPKPAAKTCLQAAGPANRLLIGALTIPDD
jgi:hypothetical protein